MRLPLDVKNIYTLCFADDQIVLAQDKDDMEYMTGKMKNIINGGWR